MHLLFVIQLRQGNVHEYVILVPRALFPGFEVGHRPTSKAREKRLGDEVDEYVLFKLVTTTTNW